MVVMITILLLAHWGMGLGCDSLVLVAIDLPHVVYLREVLGF